MLSDNEKNCLFSVYPVSKTAFTTTRNRVGTEVIKLKEIYSKVVLGQTGEGQRLNIIASGYYRIDDLQAEFPFTIFFPTTYPDSAPFIYLINPDPTLYQRTTGLQWYEISGSNGSSVLVDKLFGEGNQWNQERTLISAFEKFEGLKKRLPPFFKVGTTMPIMPVQTPVPVPVPGPSNVDVGKSEQSTSNSSSGYSNSTVGSREGSGINNDTKKNIKSQDEIQIEEEQKKHLQNIQKEEEMIYKLEKLRQNSITGIIHDSNTDINLIKKEIQDKLEIALDISEEQLKLSIFNDDLVEKNKVLDLNNDRVLNFFDKYDGLYLDEKTIKDCLILQTEDAQLVDLIAENKAIEDTLEFFNEDRFNTPEDFDKYITFFKEKSQAEFINKYLIQKLMRTKMQQ